MFIITPIKDDLSKINLGARVNLEPYNTDVNVFTVPNDGYVWIGASVGGTFTWGRIYGSTLSSNYVDLLITSSNVYDIANSTFVKKGMKLRFISKTGTTAAAFFFYIPLI